MLRDITFPGVPAHYSLEEAIAWTRGWEDGRITGEASQFIVTPYDVDNEAALYEAWQAGYDAAP